ncbi:MAG TPA: universal stress protein [Vicinamibacterales bacterium]
MSISKRILVPIDFSKPSLHALEYAKSLATSLGASLDLLHVVPNPYISDPSGLYTALPQSLLDDFDRDARARLEGVVTPEERKSFQVQNAIKIGNPLSEIVDYARVVPVDLIVMGTNGRSGVSHLLLGSVAERVVRTASCPVLTVR